MSRYIDADKIIFHEIDEIGGEYEPYLGCSKKQIDDIKTADVQPVIHAKWKKIIDVQTENIMEWHYECSICGSKRSGVCEDLNSYCPNCGAKMDLKG